MATINVTDLATALDTDGRTTRKFLRSITPKEDQPGKGSKWAIEKRDVRSLKSKFAKWDEARTAPKAPVEAEVPEVDEEPTAEELAELEAEIDD